MESSEKQIEAVEVTKKKKIRIELKYRRGRNDKREGEEGLGREQRRGGIDNAIESLWT